MEKGSSSGAVIGGIVAVVLVIAGIVWFVNRDDSNKEANNNQSTSQSASNQEQKTPDNIVVLASNTGSLSTLVSAVKAAELVDTLQGTGPYTVFAPTNDAFAKLPAGTLDTLLKPENKEQLKAILTYHVVPGEVMASDLKDGQQITTVQGGTLTVKISGGQVQLIDAKGNVAIVEKADVDASNGVVHVINGVLLPS